ncbi:MAG: APC family permease, partial [Mycobacteriales bacterium]
IASYRQTCRAYPSGGGASAVASANLGRSAGLAVASALLVDYVLTVAVSVVAGVAAVTSAAPSLARHAVGLSVVAIVMLTVVNLRGVKESGRAFAVPTYGFVAIVFLMLAVAAVKALLGHPVQAESAHWSVKRVHETGGLLTVFLVLRAFASGCTALTGVEAISNGVPSFRQPKSRNAANTLAVMGALAVTMFVGITALAVTAHVHMAENSANLVGAPVGHVQKTALSQLGIAVFGHGMLFLLLQGFTAAILILAANTAYNGFPVLASLLSKDSYLPRQLAKRGDRLVFSNGIVVLALLSVLLVVAFDANVTKLIQLYIIGVFVSFTLSQWGMVKHWATLNPPNRRRLQALNGAGAAATAVVLVVVLLTKLVHGAWIVVVAMPLLFLMMQRIARHYARVAEELRPAPGGVPLPSRIHGLVPVSKLHEPTLRALAFARATRPHDLVAVTVEVDHDETQHLLDAWAERSIPVPLVILESPYREISRPLLDYVKRIRLESPRDVVCVFIPEYVVGHWWEHLLHNQSALRLKGRLLFQPRVMVASVPWQLDSSLPLAEEVSVD